jgi:hypothetical protein
VARLRSRFERSVSSDISPPKWVSMSGTWTLGPRQSSLPGSAKRSLWFRHASCGTVFFS